MEGEAKWRLRWKKGKRRRRKEKLSVAAAVCGGEVEVLGTDVKG